jgi:hypothetical protein
MRTLFVSTMLAAALAAPALAGDADFRAIVSGVESGYGVHRERIPLFGLARFAVNIAHPEGVKDFDMAIFAAPGGPPLDARRFDAIMRRDGGSRWNAVVRVRKRRGRDEWVSIYARPDGRDWRMLIATFSGSGAVILEARVDVDFLVRALDDPEHAGRALDTNAGSNEP